MKKLNLVLIAVIVLAIYGNAQTSALREQRTLTKVSKKSSAIKHQPGLARVTLIG